MVKFKFSFFISLLLAVSLMQFGSDVYAPSLPAIAAGFRSTYQVVKLSMVVYMVGVGVAHFVYGPLSEGVGRKLPILIGLFIMAVGTLVCLMAGTIEMILIGRTIQGLGAGATATLWRSIFRDVYQGKALASISSYFGVFSILIMATAPAVGGYLQHYLDWRGSFIFMLVYCLVTFFIFFNTFRETNVYSHPERLRLSFILSAFKTLLVSPRFTSMAACALFIYSGMFSWLMTGPILLIHNLGLTAVTYGWVMMIGSGSAYVFAMRLNADLVKHYGPVIMLRIGALIAVLSAFAMVLCQVFFGVHVWSIVVPATGFVFGGAIIFPNAMSLAFTPHGDLAGYAGTLYGGIQILGAGVIGALLSHFTMLTQRPLALAMLLCAVIAVLIAIFILPSHANEDLKT